MTHRDLLSRLLRKRGIVIQDGFNRVRVHLVSTLLNLLGQTVQTTNEPVNGMFQSGWVALRHRHGLSGFNPGIVVEHLRTLP
jgi:hypothetical protein